MQIVAKSNRSLTEIPSFKGLELKPHELYQHFILGLFQGYRAQVHHLVDRMSALAHYAYALRRIDIIEEVSRVLLNLPIPDQHKSVGRYYQAMCLKHEGKISESRILLERLAEEAPPQYQARAVQYLGAIAHATGEHREALPLYVEACRISMSNNWCDPYTTVTASQNIAILKSVDGDHKGALVALERLFPLVQALGKFEPYKYHHYLNSFAVELGELGRIEEAQNVCRITLASPFINAYPEWRETWQELALRGYKSRSVVSVPKLPVDSKNVVPLPVAERSSSPPQQGRAKVLDLQAWREKMVKEPNGDDKPLPEDMTAQDMAMKILELITANKDDEEKIRKLMESAIKIFSGKK